MRSPQDLDRPDDNADDFDADRLAELIAEDEAEQAALDEWLASPERAETSS